MNKSSWVFLGIGALLLVGLFIWFKPPASPGAAQPTPAKLIAPAQVFELIVEQGQLISGPAIIQVRQGEEITLVLTSDRNDELHVHGYDLQLHLPAHQAASLHFKADRSGRFDFELHESHLQLGTLEVLPR